jgi:hypothetical protein
MVLAHAGDIDGAVATVCSDIANLETRGCALKRIVEIAAQAGAFDSARDVVDRIEALHYHFPATIELATRLADVGEVRQS